MAGHLHGERVPLRGNLYIHIRQRNFLFHNNRDGTFTDVTERAGLTRSGWGQGCCIGDYDNDGFDDLVVTYWGGIVLYHNNGDGTFTM